VGLAEAAKRAGAFLAEESGRLQALREEVEVSVLREIPGSHLNGESSERTPNTSNFRFDDVDGEDLVKRLDREGSPLGGAARGAIAFARVDAMD
jgi:cysteine desulfurase